MSFLGLPSSGSASLASTVVDTLATAPRFVWWVYGDSTDGGTTPDTVTQASIDALIAVGVPSDNIYWIYEAAPTFVIASLASAVGIDNIVLTGGALIVSDLVIASNIENITMNQWLFNDNFSGTDGAALDITLWPTEYKFGTGIDTTNSNATIDTNDAKFYLTHSSGTANIGINEVALPTLDISGTNKYKITIGIRPTASPGSLNGFSLVPSVGVGAWNTAGDATNAPNALCVYSSTFLTDAGLVIRKRTAGTTNYTTQYDSVFPSTSTYKTITLEVSLNSVKLMSESTTHLDSSESIPLDGTTKLVLWSLSDGTSSTSTAYFRDVKIEKIQ